MSRNRVVSVFVIFVSSMTFFASSISAADLIIKPTAVALTDTTEDSNRPALIRLMEVDSVALNRLRWKQERLFRRHGRMLTQVST